MRRLLDQDGEQPGVAHDSNVLRAARSVAETPVIAPRVRRMSGARTWALAASITVVLIGGALEWRARPGANDESPNAEVWISPTLIDPGLTRGQRDARRLAFARGATTVRLRLRMTAPVTSNAFDAELSTSSGRVLHRVHDIRPIAASDAVELDVDVPVSTLSAGSYVVTIRPEGASEGTATDDYAFAVSPP